MSQSGSHDDARSRLLGAPVLVGGALLAGILLVGLWALVRFGFGAGDGPGRGPGGGAGRGLAEAAAIEGSAGAQEGAQNARPDGAAAAGSRASLGGQPAAGEAVRIRGSLDRGGAELVDERLTVVAFERPRSTRDLLGFLKPDDESESAGAAAARLQQRFSFEADLGRLAPIAIAQVRADGGFELRLEPRDDGRARRRVHLGALGDLIATAGTRPVVLDGPLVEGVRLVGRAGSLIEGRLIPDSALGDIDLSRFTVSIDGGMRAGVDVFSAAPDLFDRRVEVLADGRFELRAVPLTGRFELIAAGPGAAPGYSGRLELSPGGRESVRILLEQGSRVRGRVTDEAGDPLEGAEIELAHARIFDADLRGVEPVFSGADGRFEIAHSPAGRFELIARKQGFEIVRQPLEQPLTPGGEVEDMWLQLGRGLGLRGILRRSDGGSAGGAMLAIEVSPEVQIGLQSFTARDAGGGEVECSPDGEFELLGLKDLPYVVRAELELPDGVLLRGRAESVKPSLQRMELLLEPVHALAGRVLDDEGAALDAFEVVARLEDPNSSPMAAAGIDARVERERFDGVAGEFELSGLERGLWKVRADAFGRSAAEWIELEVPAAEPLELRLGPAARIEGRVVDPAGAPVPGARVAPVLELGSRIDLLRRGELPSVVADSAGAFVLPDLDAGAVELRATHPLWGMSPVVELQLDPGSRAFGTVLQLSDPSRLTGEAFGRDGAPLVDASVTLQRVPNFDGTWLGTVGEEGSFEFGGLSAGRYQLLVVPHASVGAGAMSQLLSSLLVETVDLGEKQTRHVVLGLAPADPVEITGRVLHAGEPVSKALLQWVLAGDEGLQNIQFVSADEQGRYRAQLGRAGAYQIGIQLSEGVESSHNRVSFLRRVESSEDVLELDFELPGSSVSGRVTDAEGAAVAKCRVSLHPDLGASVGSLFGSDYTEVATDVEGRYRIEYVRPGSYRLSVGGPARLGLLGTAAAHARSSRGSLLVEPGAHLEGLDFRLEQPCTLVGRVLDAAGEPVDEADVFVRDASGQLVERVSVVGTSPSGRFTYAGLAPGDYTVSARSETRISRESARIELGPRLTPEVELRLEPGTLLRVQVTDTSGETIRTGFDLGARLSVVDSDGREFASMASMRDVYDAHVRGFSEHEQTVGPLPAGEYLVTVTAADGRSKRKAVDLKAQDERVLKVRLR